MQQKDYETIDELIQKTFQKFWQYKILTVD